MKTIKIEDNKYEVKKTLKSTECIYYYTIDPKNDNQVVLLRESILNNGKIFEKVDEREYPILMNKFALE